MSSPITDATPAKPRASNVSTGRDAFYDVIRAAAILRVVAWHTFQWPVLSYIAAMPVMFFVGGRMARSSFERRPAIVTVGARLRRLLPPLWVYAAFAWAVFLVIGLATTNTPVEAPWRLLWWVVPLSDPVGPESAVAWWAPLWYLRAYLWLVIATPLLLGAHRRYGAMRIVTVAGTVAGAVALLTTSRSELLPVSVRDFGLYGAFWVVGLASRDLGEVARLRSARVRASTAVACGALGGAWMVTRPVPLGVVNAAPVAELLFGLAWVVGLTAVAPALRRLGTNRRVAGAVALFNRRAVTIYLWHCAAIAIAREALGAAGGWVHDLALAVAVVAGTGLFVVLAGPIEDLSSRKRRRGATSAPRVDRRLPLGVSATVLAAVVLLLATAPVIDLRSTDATYVPASGRGLDRLIAAETTVQPGHRTPVVAGSGPVQASEMAGVVADWRDDWEMSGVIAAVARSDGAAMSAAAGIDEPSGQLMRSDQTIAAHSVTKSFTGALVAQLHAEQLLDLDERLAVWVPEFPHASRMSLRQLAQHASGLVDTGESPAVAIEIAGSVPLQFEPGEGTGYSDSGYFLLALAAERATGMTYEDLVLDRLIAPLGLGRTSLHNDARWSAGGLVSTADELARWATAFWGGRLGEGVAHEARTLDPHNNFGIGTFGYCPCDGTGVEYIPQFYGHLSAQGRLAWDPVDGVAVMIHTNEENDGGRTIDAWNDLDHRLRELTAGRSLSPVEPEIVSSEPAEP